jgi:DNA-binding MarR family transcriptional regulator
MNGCGMPKKTRVTPMRLPLDRRFGYRFHMISRALGQQMLAHVGREYGLNIAEYRIMTVLANHKKPSIKDIAAHTDLDKAHVTRALANLARRGLASQKIDTRDRRLREVRLTPAGMAMIDDLDGYVSARQKRLERRLTKSELDTLWHVMAALSDEIDRMLVEVARSRGGRPSRVSNGSGSPPSNLHKSLR